MLPHRSPIEPQRNMFRLRRLEDYLFGVDQFMNPNEKLKTLDFSKGAKHIFLSVLLSGVIASLTTLDSGTIMANLEAGASSGMDFLWVISLGIIIGWAFQITATRLGLATEEDLSEHCEEEFPKVMSKFIFVIMKISVICTDMAQLIGVSVGLNVLFSLPLPVCLLATFLDFILVKHIYNDKIKYFEVAVGSVIFLSSFCFFVSLLFSKIGFSHVISGLKPTLPKSLLGTALCVFASTFSPQSLFLQSGIVTTRMHEHSERIVRDIILATSLELVVCKVCYWFVMLMIMSLSTREFYENKVPIRTLQDGSRLLSFIFPRGLCDFVYGLTLVCTGLVGSIQTTLCDHSATEKYMSSKYEPFKIHGHIRLISFLPVFLISIFGGSDALYSTIYYCLIIVSMCTPLIVICLVKFTSDQSKMGPFVNNAVVASLMYTITALLLIANLAWIAIELTDAIKDTIPKAASISIISVIGLLYITAFTYICIYDFNWFARYVTKSQWRHRFMVPNRYGYHAGDSHTIFPLDNEEDDDF